MSSPPSIELRSTVSFVGIGNMGLAMVGRLRDLGWPVAVCDIDEAACSRARELGAQVHASPLALARAMPTDGLVVVAVVDAAQCRDVMWGDVDGADQTVAPCHWRGLGAAQALQPGQTVMWCPTISPADVETLAGRLAVQGVHSIDAPMSGGPARARAGSMSLMVAGASEVVMQHEPVLSALANPVFRLGERLGDGARTKLVNNLLAGINLVGAAEVLALAANMGLDMSRTLDVIGQSSGQSWIGDDRMRRAVAHDLVPRAHMSLLAKDTRLANEAAAAAGFAGPLGARAAAVFRAACESGLSELDDSALLLFLQQHGQSR
ncbi:MAG TPA: NAD(P)-dependent oxidoreductase [Burkholderiaceae bacterium]|nr:NAD(P)-dependent oxidoreductase [Burkholderiaceae bacterium]